MMSSSCRVVLKIYFLSNVYPQRYTIQFWVILVYTPTNLYMMHLLCCYWSPDEAPWVPVV